MVGGAETIRMAFQPLKAPDQSDQIAEVFGHGSSSRPWLFIK
jgi:hypothetical protein